MLLPEEDTPCFMLRARLPPVLMLRKGILREQGGDIL